MFIMSFDVIKIRPILLKEIDSVLPSRVCYR